MEDMEQILDAKAKADPVPQDREHGDQTSAELFSQISHIAITLSYDLIDKLRYWEKETLKLPDDEIEKRLGHAAVLLDRLKKAYLQFADTDI